MVTLTERISSELNQALSLSEQAFDVSEIDQDLLEREEVRILRRARLSHDKLQSAKEEFERQISKRTREFTLENIAATRNAFQRLDIALPSQERTEEIADLIEKSMEETRHGLVFKSVRGLLPITLLGSSTGLVISTIAGAEIAPSYFIPATMFGYSIYTVMKEWVGRKNPNNVSSANYAAAGGAFLFAVNNALTDLVGLGPEDVINFPMFLAMITSELVSYAFSLGAGFSRKFRDHINSRRSLFESSRSQFNHIARYAVVLEEARRGLNFVRKWVGKGVERSEFDEQIEGLERVLEAYIIGRAEPEDIAAARIAYTQPERERGERYAPRFQAAIQQPSYEELKAQEAAEETRRKRKRGWRRIWSRSQTPGVEEQPEVVTAEEEIAHVYLSPKLERLKRKKGARVDKYEAKVVVAAARAKLESNPDQGRVIRRTTDGRETIRLMIERHGARYGFTDTTTFYNMNPIGSTRAIFARDGNNMILLEAVSHPDYDRKAF